jgi:WD40 repeat protein
MKLPGLEVALVSVQETPTLSLPRLLALLRTDQRERWARGERVMVEAYLERWPALRENAEAILDLLYAEHLLREEAGAAPALDEYRDRFPALAGEMARQLELHAAWSASRTLATVGPATVDELVLLWRERRAGGETVTPEELCAGRPDLAAPLRQRISDLERMEALLGVGATVTAWPNGAEKTLAAPPGVPVPAALGIPGYEVLGLLGRGGMGVVYRARQVGLDRMVALKMILAGEHAGQPERARFQREAEAVARLSHPNIVQVYEVGEHQGLPFFSLELCAGGSLADRLDGTPWAGLAAATLVETLARAVHAAHQAGVVHRDLKPGNVLLSGPAKPQAAEIKITDFGLAKRLDDSCHTGTGAVLGTPSYMAPEQARGDPTAVGPATDVYALGAILYELLTGRPPFKASTAMDTVVQVLQDDPVAPSRLHRQVPLELETIALKCLQKEPDRRYASALELADDLGAFRDGRPIRARPVGLLGRLGKWTRRRPALAALAGLSIATAAVSLVLVTWKWREASAAGERSEQARVVAERELERAEASLYFNRIALADREFQGHNVARARAILAECDPARRGWEWGFLMRACQGGLLSLRGHTARVSCVSVSADGRWLASGSYDGTARLWDRAAGRCVRTWAGQGRVHGVAFDPAGRRLATAGEGGVRLWDVGTAGDLGRLSGHRGPVTDVAFAPDGQTIATCAEDQKVILWDAGKRAIRHTLTGHTNTVSRVAFVPGGTRLVSAGFDDRVIGWDMQTGKESFRCQGHRDGVVSVAASPDGKWIASAGGDRAVMLWDASGTLVRVLRGHTNAVHAVAFSPDSRRLASGSADRTVRVWDVDTGVAALTLCGHQGTVHGLAWAPDGGTIVSAAGDHRLKVWSAHSELPCVTFDDAGGAVQDVAFHPDGRLFASVAEDGKVRLRDIGTGRLLKTVSTGGAGAEGLTGIVFAPRGRLMACPCSDRSVRLFDLDGKPGEVLEGHQGIITCVAFAPGGTLTTAGHDQRILLWDGGKKPWVLSGHEDTIRGLEYLPDGRHLLSAGEDRTVRCWRQTSGTWKEAWQVKLDAAATHLAVAPGGKVAAVGDEDGRVTLLSTADGESMHALEGHGGKVHRVCFSPDGKRLASAGADGAVKLWDVTTGQELLTLRGHRGEVLRMAFSPDGKTLATGGEDQAVRLWSATPLPGE